MKQKRILLRLLPLLWVALFSAWSDAASNALPHQAFPSSWQAALDRFAGDKTIPGAVVIVKSPEWGVRVGVTGYANLPAKEKMSPDLHFRIGSVTKVFTAQMILMLEQQGRIKFTDPVLRYLGDNPAVAAIPNIGRVTIADCLQMKSGIASYTAHPTIATSADVDPGRQFTPTELLRVLAPDVPNPLTPDFAPGDTYPNPYWIAFRGPSVPAPPEYPPYNWWMYSNSNYILLGLVVEKVSGMPIAEAVQRLICRPLGLSDTLFAVDLNHPENMMRGYTRLDALRNPIHSDWRDVTDVNPSAAWAAGAGISTPWDVLRFLETILKTGKLLNQGTRRKWLTFVSADIHWAGVQYGMGGLMQLQRPYGDCRGHGGAYSGFKNVMYYFRDSDTTLIIAANTWDGQPEVDIMDAIMTLVTSAPAEPRPAPGRTAGLESDGGLTLEWQPGFAYGDAYTVFWGTRADLVEAATKDSHQGVEMKTTSYPRAAITGLAPDQTYFWRVETVSTQSAGISGPLWRFRTGTRPD
jgi:CubicO group peptidase (beta-lactamase class C family)